MAKIIRIEATPCGGVKYVFDGPDEPFGSFMLAIHELYEARYEAFLEKCLPDGRGGFYLPMDDNPPPTPAVVAVWCDLDHAAWSDAVARQGVAVSYLDVLYSDHWHTFRDAVRTGRCARCKRDGATDLHHITYARLGHERPEDVLELCRDCHDLAHGRGYRRAA